jgi:hypothetical protein
MNNVSGAQGHRISPCDAVYPPSPGGLPPGKMIPAEAQLHDGIGVISKYI